MIYTKFQNCRAWLNGEKVVIDSSCYSKTRDVFEGRLNKFPSVVKKLKKFNDDNIFLLTAAIGEIGNNSFDHNLGQWSHEPGIYFSYHLEGSFLYLLVADRGRGIKASLAAVHDGFYDDQVALDTAFTKKITGRFPEKRGNGLKFVRQVVNGDQKRGLWCQSGLGVIEFGKFGNILKTLARDHLDFANLDGTITLIAWGAA